MSEYLDKIKKLRETGKTRYSDKFASDLIDYADDLERQLAEAMNKLNKIESVCNGYKAMQSEYETGTEIPYWDIMNIIKEQLKEKGDETS